MAYSIPLLRRFRTAGTQDSFGHVFYNNNFLIERTVDRGIDTYLLPGMSACTGTYDFYESQRNSVFLIYTRPALSFFFTANTQVFTSDTRLTYIVQDLHKIRHEDVEEYRATRSSDAWQRVADSIASPIISYSSSTSAVTTAFTLTILPEQFIKPSKGYTEEIFEDRAEYFLNTRFIFSASSLTDSGSTSGNTSDLLTYNVIDDEGNIITSAYTETEYFLSNDRQTTITYGSWSGVSVNGVFFTCFQPPSKPILHFPFVATAVTQNGTFTPTFNFSNVEDGDSFVLEVTYDMTDTGFTNTDSFSGVTQYFREKTVDNVEQTLDKSTTVDVIGSERSTSIKVRRINAPIKKNSLFLYRIGNVKSVTNIFDVEQRVINYSTFATGATGSFDSIRVYVDSRNTEVPATPSNISVVNTNGLQVAQATRSWRSQ